MVQELRRHVSAFVLGLAMALPLAADDAAAGGGAVLPSPEELVAQGAKIGRIDVEIGNIFATDDPEEDSRLFHWVNRLHRLTRPHIVTDRLLFGEGDAYDPDRLRESERLLRELRYFYDADVRPTAYDPVTREVTVGVKVRDVWTLKGGVKIGRSGGENSFGFGLEDDNFLGTGKSLKVDRRQDVDRSSTAFRYFDPAIAGSRWQMLVENERNSDGDVYGAELELPFFSLDARRAFGFKLRREASEVRLYQLGSIADRFQRDHDHAELYFGFSAGLAGRRVWRWLSGVTFEDATFSPAVTGLDGGDVVGPATGFLPAPRRLVYPFVGVSTAADRFAKTHDFDQIARTEDLQLGLAAEFSLGYASRSFGSDRDAFVFQGLGSGGFELGRRQILLYDARLSGRYGSAGAEDVVLSAGLRYHLRDFGDNLLVLEGHVDWSRGLDGDHQLLLGGDSGLRGYPLRYQSGERRFLFTAEQRVFTDWYPFRLINVGAAAFFDLGRTDSDDPAAGNRGWLADVGVGLRLASSRTHHGSMIHIDLAAPLDRDPGIDAVQLLVRTKTSF